MINWPELVISGVIIVLYALFMWKVWPTLKDSAIAKKAKEIVYLMEELFGAKTGDIKFDKAKEMLQNWIDARGWKISVENIANYVTAAVGALHAEQGKIPSGESDG